MSRLLITLIALLALIGCAPNATIDPQPDGSVLIEFTVKDGAVESYASILNFQTDHPRCVRVEAPEPGSSCVFLNATGDVRIEGHRIDENKQVKCTINYIGRDGLPLAPDFCRVKE